MLEAIKYNVNSVASGEAAIFYLKKKSADLLVLNMTMEPGLDGLDTYRQILKINPSCRLLKLKEARLRLP